MAANNGLCDNNVAQVKILSFPFFALINAWTLSICHFSGEHIFRTHTPNTLMTDAFLHKSHIILCYIWMHNQPLPKPTCPSTFINNFENNIRLNEHPYVELRFKFNETFWSELAFLKVFCMDHLQLKNSISKRWSLLCQ